MTTTHTRAVVLVGPTSSGKTDLSMSVADNRFEIISVDSVQIYKYFDIGSGKPGPEELKRVPHHLIDLVEPDYPFTAGDFCREASKAVEDILNRDRIPFFVGGTGLYFDSFFQGLSDIPEINTDLREELKRELKDKGLQFLYNELLEKDPVFGRRLHPHDRQRILRGLEVYRGTGRTLSSYFWEGKKGYFSGNVLYIGLREEPVILKGRIEERVDKMMDNGFIDEVKTLRERGFGPELKSMKSIGYAEINRYIDGKMDLDETVRTIKSVTVKYAKRQMTWFKKNKKISWFAAGKKEEVTCFIQKWVRGPQ